VVTITSPTNGATVTSPIHIVANEGSSHTASSMTVQLDGAQVYSTATESVDTTVAASAGAHRIDVTANYPDTASVTSTVNVTVGGAVTISQPANGASVASPIHFVADENTSASATSMQIYLDGALYVTRTNVDHLDEQVTAGNGSHTLTAKAWYADGTNNMTQISVTVVTPVTVSSPASGASVSSPIHVVADENTSVNATSMQIYLDGTLYVTRYNVDHLDEQVTAAPGSHTLTAKAWYADGTSNMTQVTCTVLAAVTISSPAAGATVSSPIHVVADENTAVNARSMQIYLDGTLYVTRDNVDHLDEQVTAAAGSHTLTAKAWYADGTSNMTQVTCTVSAPVTISSPAAGASVQSPIHVVADENTAVNATSMQIYLDGSLYVTRDNVDHLDEQVTAAPGSHTLTAKAWYADGTSNMTQVTCTVMQPVTISTPSNGATVSSPIHVVADENTAVNATSMQIYLDGSLYVTRYNVDHLDEQVTAGSGTHTLTAKAWYADGTNNLTQISVTVP
jgi:Holliday junction resolvase